MAEKNRDRHGRWRSRTVAFRMSDEEKRELDRLVLLSGLTKQDYITARLLERDIVVVPSCRVQKGLEDVALLLLMELKRIGDVGEMTIEVREVLEQFATIMREPGKDELPAQASEAERKIVNMERK